MDRRTFLKAGVASTAAYLAGGAHILAAAPRPKPTADQLAWQRDEVAIFLHFGVNTFTDREWGDGRESPSIFAPSRLDARQWARAAEAAGARAMILTAKHHDGFCLWPTRTTQHSVKASPFRAGQGDVVKEFVEACRAHHLRPGLYLSPWDRNHPSYGDSDRYMDTYIAQLTELLTGYGPLAEVWFDGANGEGPNGKKQVYDWPRVWKTVRQHQPHAVIFSDSGPDVRWCGNENGSAGDPNWSTVDPAKVPAPGTSGPGVIDALQHGDPDGGIWRPAEADVSIRPGWFHHPAEDARVKSADTLVNLYFRSVGRNSKLLLNVPPTRDGLLHDTDVANLTAFGERRHAMFALDLAESARLQWRLTGATTAELVVEFVRPTSVGVVRLAEPVERGQVVSRYTVHGADGADWRVLSQGTTIGHARLDRFGATTVRRLRLTVDDAVAPIARLRLSAFAG
jgi:alpha-L-fucosidase